MNETEEKTTTPVGSGSETRKKTRQKMPRWKKVLLCILVIHLLFTVIDAAWMHGPGVSSVLQHLGEAQLTVNDLRWRIEPDKNEFLITWTESLDYCILPVPVWTSQIRTKTEQFERRIPLDPLPDELVRCFVDVTTAPDAPSPLMHTPMGAPYGDVGPKFSERNAVLVEPHEFGPGQMRDLPHDMVFRLTVRPEDVPLLSNTFIMTPRLGELHSFLIMVPQLGEEEEGRRVMFLSRSGGDGGTPYYEELCVKWRQEREDLSKKSAGFLAICWKIVWLPLAALPDYIWGAYILFILIMLSQVDWC